jgi:glycosyltransferase involved in cell wall biosynthesis
MKARGMNYKTPLHHHPAHGKNCRDGWLILPELSEGRHVRLIIGYARQRGMRVAGIFYDAIPWLHPEMVRHRTREQHADYMMAFAELDAVIPISHQSARHFTEFVQSQGRAVPRVKACPLPAQILGQERETELKKNSDGTLRILCVSTLEPRKNHARIISAFQAASCRLGDLKVELHLAGAPYGAAPEIAGAVRALTSKNPAIVWHESVSPAELRKLYRDCDFTVFGSWIEGFGLPVMESLWFGKPCLCSDEGVMAENAAGGGCLMVDVQNFEALADGMVKLAGQPDFRRELAEQTLRRKLKTWDDYAGEILQILKET